MADNFISAPDTPGWPDVYQIEVTDKVVGGPDGISNRQAKSLVERTAYLKKNMEAGQQGLTSHVNAADPHPQYTTDQEVAAAIDAKTTVAGFAKKGDANAWVKGQAGAVSLLPATSGTVTLDLSQANNWDGTLTGNITLANPVSMPVGQSGVVRITQGATPFVIAYGSVWKSSNGALPGLTASANAVDVLGYYVESASRILIVSQGDVR